MKKVTKETDIFVDEFGVIYDNARKRIVITDKLSNIQKYTVKDGTEIIESTCFMWLDDLIEVNLPDSVKVIESKAFYRCKNLRKINFGNGLECVKEEAFYGCPKLYKFHFPKNLKEFVPKFIDYYSSKIQIEFAQDNPHFTSDNDFVYSKDLTKIVLAIQKRKNKNIEIPDGITEIGNKAFSYNFIVNSLKMPESVKYIGDFAFYGCCKLEHVQLSKNTVSIGEGCFSKTLINQISIPSKVVKVGVNAFVLCLKLESVNVDMENLQFKSIEGVLYTKNQKTLIVYPANSLRKKYIIPQTVSSVTAFAFMAAENLTEIVMSDKIKVIEKNTFADCSNLMRIIWSKRLRRISRNAFQNCSELTSIRFPKSLVQIDESAFEFCHKLKHVFLPQNVVCIQKEAFLNTNSIKFRISRNNANFIINDDVIYEKRFDIHFKKHWFDETYDPNVPF
jgi:hypothetical protein